MHPNLYLSLELRRTNKTKWRLLLIFPDIGCDIVLFTLLGYKTPQAEIDMQECLPARGFPVDVADDSIAEDAYTIDDESAKSNIAEILDNVRFCSEAQAKEWVDLGFSRFINGASMVTDPECYGQSWASYEEFRNLVQKAEKYKGYSVHLLKAFLAAMVSLQEDGYNTRIIYWFEG
jgi:hypothetical protein